jgi:hypothetical protein
VKIPDQGEALSILEHFRESLSKYQQTRNQADAVAAEKLYKQVEFTCKVVGVPLTAKWESGFGGPREYEPLREWKVPHYTASAIALVEEAILEIKAGNYKTEKWFADQQGEGHLVDEATQEDEESNKPLRVRQTGQSKPALKPEEPQAKLKATLSIESIELEFDWASFHAWMINVTSIWYWLRMPYLLVRKHRLWLGLLVIILLFAIGYVTYIGASTIKGITDFEIWTLVVTVLPALGIVYGALRGAYNWYDRRQKSSGDSISAVKDHAPGEDQGSGR